MNIRKLFVLMAFLSSLLYGYKTFGQLTKIRGKITDASTGQPIAFVNVSFKGSTIGTVSNTEGEFFLETREVFDSLMISAVGYKKQNRKINKFLYQQLNIALDPAIYQLNEIVIVPTENPAHQILRSIIANKKKA